MELVKKICSLFTLIVLVLTECFMPINYSFAENDDAEDFQVEENIVQDNDEVFDEDYEYLSETEENIEENAEEDVQEDTDEGNFDEDLETNEDDDEKDNVEDLSDEIENNENEGTFDDNSETINDEENNKEDSSDETENNEDEGTFDDNSEISNDEENSTEDLSLNDASDGEIGNEINSLALSQNDNNISSGIQGNESEGSNNNIPMDSQATGQALEQIDVNSGVHQNNDNEEDNDNEDNKKENEDEEDKGIIDEISEEVQNIIDKIRYFFKKDGSTKYIKYGNDSNNIGTITLKDPETGVSITVMDKNLGAESAGIGKNSYGYYFQWGNNHGVKTVNSSNKTTQKAVYNDIYDNRGYDGQGAFVVGSTDYWENGAHYNNLWGNESKESSRYGACPVGYHIPTMKEWNQLLNIWGKIHTQDTSSDETKIRYSASYPTKEIHTFKGAATQCAQGDTDCVDEDKLSSIVNVLSSELKLPLAGEYDENGNYHEGVGIYWTSVSKYSNTAGVFDMDVYFGEGGSDALIYKAQGHNIRCFQDIYAYEAPVLSETQCDDNELSGMEGNESEEVGNDMLMDSSGDESILEGQTGSGVDSSLDVQNDGNDMQDAYLENDIPSDIESDLIIQDIAEDLVNEGIDVEEYTITWKNEDGTVRDITRVAYGQMPTHEDPVQPADLRYSYQFAGWEPELKVVEGDAEYKAKYIYIPMEYTITWKNEDGTVRDTTKLAYGQLPTHEDPVQPADAHYSYQFAGWEPAISEVKGNAEYKAKYVYTVNKYTITWKDGDGNVLKISELEYGSTPTYDGATPTKESDGDYEYTFAGWESEISEVVGNMEYVAKFDSIKVENEEIENEGVENEEVEDSSIIISELQTGDEVDSSLEYQDTENISSGTEGSETEGSYVSLGGGGNTQDSSFSTLEGQDDAQESEELEEDQGFFEGLRETLKSFFLDDEDGYLRGSETIDNIVVSVEAEEGTFPEGTEVVIKGVSQDRLESIQTSLINDETNKVTENAQIMAFDISFVYNGEEIQPEKEVSVKFDYKNNTDLQGAKASELSIYHIDDDTDEGMEIDIVNKDGDEVEILATDFSIYVLALTPTDTFTLTLDAGEGSVVTGGNISVNGNGVGTISDVNGEVILPGATRQNYQFSGWYMTGGVYVGNSGDTYNVTDDITLYAEWQEEVMYTVTFDANRGTFVDGVIPNTPTPKSQSISDGTLITQAPTVEFPGYNLTGWWTEPRGGIQWDFANDIVTGNITLYAHWMYGEEYGDLDIYIWKNESTTGHYTFMDRNLGATELYDKVYCNKDDGNSCTTRRDYDSYGYYYQQGNNYGFDSYAENHGALSNGRTGSLNISSYSWSNPYISSTFAGVGVENWTTNTNLWGGSQSDPSRKQGPCPDGYHVPNRTEWENVWEARSGGNTRSNNVEYISKDLLLPAASYRQRANTEVLVSDLHHFRYLSSTYRYIFGDDNNANLTRIMKIYQEKISNGFSVRCIKDVKNEGSSAILTGIELNGGEKAIISIAEGKIQSLQAPTKAGYVFSGWYTTSDYQTGTKVVEGSPISAGTELYAKWDCPDGLVYNSNNQCVPGVLVRFMDGESEYTRNVVLSGLEVTPPADPEKLGHIFTGWFESGANLPFVFTGTPITGNLDLYAHWDINKYNVNVSVVTGDEGYLSGMGSTGISLTGLYDYGAELVFIAIPESGYVFDYWMNEDQVLSGTDLGDGKNQLTVFANQDLDIIAFFKSEDDTPTPYTVEHYQQNLGLTGYDFVWSGIMYGTANEQTNAIGTNYEGFTLSGNLSNYQTGIKADGSTVVRLYYNRDVYTITFENWNGDFLWSGKVANGEMPTYGGSTPTRASTQQSVYTFDGWYPEPSPITMDTTYIAVYTESTRLYTVILTGTPAGYGILSTNSLPEEYETAIVISGSQLTIGGTEVILTGNKGYEFQEWTGNCGQTTKQICDRFTVYSHPDPIEFTGGNNLVITSDGYDLFSQSGFQKDFEISFDILSLDLSGSSKQATLLSVKNEDLNNKWPGLTLRREATSSNLELTIRGGSVGAVGKIYTGSSVHSVKISRESGKLYMAINGGNKEEVYDFAGFTDYFDKPITIGSIYQNGGYSRYIKATISNILIKTIDTSSCSSGLVLAVTGDCQMTAVFTSSGSCTYGGELYENGSVLTGYQSDSVTCPNSCVSQVATCISGAWNVIDFETEYSHSSCTYSGFSCDAGEYPLQTCPENGICSSCTGYAVNDNACNQISPVYRLESCSERYHVNGNVCEIDSHTVTIVSNNINSGMVTTGSITVPYGTSITESGNVVTIGSETSTANPNTGTWQYDFDFVDWTNTCGVSVTTGCTITANFQSSLRSYILGLVINTGIDTIYYKINGADSYSSTGVTTTLSGVEAGSEIIAYAEPEPGYTTDTSLTNLWSVLVTGDNVFSPVAIVNTDTLYTVYHYVKIAGENSYALSKTETLYGTSNEILTLSSLANESEFLCAHYSSGSLTGTTSGPGPIVIQTTLNGDGSTEIYLYYTRQYHTVHLTGDVHIQKLKINGVETEQASFECGSEVPIDAVPQPGYHFVRWDKEEREEREDDEPEPLPGE